MSLPACRVIARGPMELFGRPADPPDPELEARIDELWSAALAESGGRLFNGTILSFEELRNDPPLPAIFGRFTEFKRFIAQRADPALGLAVRPVGVSGLAIVEEGGRSFALLAERSPTVSHYPGFLELVPSGSVDDAFVASEGRIDFVRLILQELKEETCWSGDLRCPPRTLGAVFDPFGGTYDVCCRLDLAAERAELLSAMRESDEYTDARFVPLDELSEWITLHAARCLPASIAIIEALGPHEQAGGASDQ